MLITEPRVPVLGNTYRTSLRSLRTSIMPQAQLGHSQLVNHSSKYICLFHPLEIPGYITLFGAILKEIAWLRAFTQLLWKNGYVAWWSNTLWLSVIRWPWRIITAWIFNYMKKKGVCEKSITWLCIHNYRALIHNYLACIHNHPACIHKYLAYMDNYLACIYK